MRIKGTMVDQIPTPTMPKCQLDEHLHQRAKDFVLRHGGNASAASAELGIDRTKFWRFVKFGRALPRTRVEVAQRLDLHDAAQTVRQSETKMNQDGPVSFGVSFAETRQLRAFCLKMLEMIDFYESVAQAGEMKETA